MELTLVPQYLAGSTPGRELPLGWARPTSVLLAVTGLALAAYTTLLFLQHPTTAWRSLSSSPAAGPAYCWSWWAWGSRGI